MWMERLEYPDTTDDTSTPTIGIQDLVLKASLRGAETTQYGVGLTRSLVSRIALEFQLRNMDYIYLIVSWFRNV